MNAHLTAPPYTIETLAAAARAPTTLKAYRCDWRDFEEWCRQQRLCPLPAAIETVAAYLAERAGLHPPSTLERRLAAMVFTHRQAGHELDLGYPLLADVRAGIRRRWRRAPAQKDALLTDDLRALVEALPGTLAGLRDKALLLVAFSGALRRSEAAALDRRDCLFTSEGVVLAIRRSKEDQESEGMIKGLPFGGNPATCPVNALRAWMLAARLDDGPLFRAIDRHGNVGGRLSGGAIARIVKRAVGQAARADGVSEAEICRRMNAVSGHSLRAGFITQAAAAGLSPLELAVHTGHKRLESLRRYMRQGTVLPGSPAGRVGL